MKLLNCEKIRLMLVGVVAAIVLGGGTAKADFTWTRKTDMPTPRCAHTSAVVNGKIYVIGGATSEPDCYALFPWRNMIPSLIHGQERRICLQQGVILSDLAP